MIYPIKWRKSNILWIDKNYTVVRVNPKYTRKYKQTKRKLDYEDFFEEDISLVW